MNKLSVLKAFDKYIKYEKQEFKTTIGHSRYKTIKEIDDLKKHFHKKINDGYIGITQDEYVYIAEDNENHILDDIPLYVDKNEHGHLITLLSNKYDFFYSQYLYDDEVEKYYHIKRKKKMNSLLRN